METRAHYVLIGTSVVATLVLALLFALWLGNAEREFDEYDIVFQERISGLQVGANVLFNGIRVGEVEELSLDNDNPSIARARVRVSEGTPIKIDTKAELELVGVTGLAVIQFVGGSQNEPLLKAVSRDRVPTIQGSAGGLAAIIENSGPLAENVANLVSAENIARITRIIEDFEAVSDAIADSSDDIATIIDSAATTSLILKRQAEALDGTTARINSILTETDELLKGDVRATLEQFAAASAELSSVMTQIDAIIEDNRPAIDTFAQEGLGQSVSVIAQANRVLATTEAILQEFDRNPSRFLLGENLPETDQ